MGGICLRRMLTDEQRNELEEKMAKLFKENIKDLSTEFQRILVDDMVTAFENRTNVLMRAQGKRSS